MICFFDFFVVQDLEYSAPSRVVFVRNLPLDVDEAELLAMAKPYGGARAVLLLQRKGQAFVELKDTHLAAAMKRGMDESPVELRGWKAMCAFSKRDRITPPPKVDVSKALAAAAGGPSATSVAGTTGTVPRVSRVLLVTIMNVVYPVTVDILQQVMAAFGEIEKVVVFVRDPNVAALVQMPSLESVSSSAFAFFPHAASTLFTVQAIKAKENLDGQCIYTNCNKMRIQFSKLDGVSVRYNNDKSRDFLNPALPQGPGDVPDGDAGQDPYASYSEAMLAYEGGGNSMGSGTSPTHSVSTGGGSPLARASKHPLGQGALQPAAESAPGSAFAPSDLPALDTRHHMPGTSMFHPGTLTGEGGTPPSLPPGLHLSPHMAALAPGSPMLSPGRAAALAAAYAIGVTPPVTGLPGPGQRGSSFSFPHHHGGATGDSSTSSGSPTARQGTHPAHSQGAPSSPTFRGMSGASRTTVTGQSIPHSPRRQVPEAAVVDSSGAHVGYRYRSGSSDFVAFGAPPPSSHPPPQGAAVVLPPTKMEGGTGISGHPPSALAEGGVEGSPADEVHPLSAVEPGDMASRSRTHRTESMMSDLDLPPSAAEERTPATSVSPPLASAAPPTSVQMPLSTPAQAATTGPLLSSSQAPPPVPTSAPFNPFAAEFEAPVSGGLPLPAGMVEGSPRHRAAMAAAAAAAHAVFSGYYPAPGGAPPHAPAPPFDPYTGQPVDPYAAMKAASMYAGHGLPGAAPGGYGGYGYPPHAPPPQPYPGMYGAPPSAALGGYSQYGQPPAANMGYHQGPPSHPSPSPVLIVSGFNSGIITAPEQLFILASAFGTVERIKIMFKRRDTALVQYASQQQAQIAQVHLHRCPLFGMHLKANFSSHHVVHLPQPVSTSMHVLCPKHTG